MGTEFKRYFNVWVWYPHLRLAHMPEHSGNPFLDGGTWVFWGNFVLGEPTCEAMKIIEEHYYETEQPVFEIEIDNFEMERFYHSARRFRCILIDPDDYFTNEA